MRCRWSSKVGPALSILLLLGPSAACTLACDDGDDASGLDTAGLEDVDEDGFCAGYDCGDRNTSVHPGAVELCDGLDNDCVPETLAEGEVDADGDGFMPCGPGPADCDDGDASRHPEAPDRDGVDQDCDGLVDEGFDTLTTYLDADGDGFGTDDSAMEACSVDDGRAGRLRRHQPRGRAPLRPVQRAGR